MGGPHQGRARATQPGQILGQVDIGMRDLARAGGFPNADGNVQIWRDIWFEVANNSV